MRRLFVIILTICMALTSCAPAVEAEPSAFGPNERALPSAVQGAAPSAVAQNAAEPVFSALEYTSDQIESLPSAPSFDYAFSSPGGQWQHLAANEAPAAFSQVSYEFADGVLEVGQVVTNSIASAGQLMSGSAVQRLQPNQIIAQGGYISRSILDAVAVQSGRTIENGMVVVDKASGVAFKVVAPAAFYDGSEQSEYLERLEGSYAIATPQLHEILKDFSLGGNGGETEEMVTITRGNITGFAPNMEANLVDDNGVKLMSFDDSYDRYKHIIANYLVNLQFKNQRLDAFLGDGSPIKVTVSGGIAIENINVFARYTCCKGYALSMTLRQESYLIVEMEAELAEEITIPVFEIGVGIGDIGRVSGGVYIIIGLDGRLRVEVYAREFTSTRIGLRGKTAAYIPVSVRPIFDQTIKADGDVKLTAKLNGSLKFGPMLGFEIFSFDLIGAGAFLGTGVSVEKDDTLLDVRLYAILQVYVKFLGKSFDLASYPTIFRKKQQDMAGYSVDILEAYVHPGRVSGIIKKEMPEPGEAVKPILYRVLVVPEGLSFNSNNVSDINNPNVRKYPKDGYASTLEGGVFFQEDKSMLSGSDRIYLEFKVDGKSFFSNPASPTLPFTEYDITRADFFNGYVTGQVQPLRLINWNTGENEWVYYANQEVALAEELHWSGYPFDADNSQCIASRGCAYVRTDEYGNFDTRNEFISNAGESIPGWKFNFFPVPPDKENYGWEMQHYFWKMRLTLNYRDDEREATVSGEVPFTPVSPLVFTRVIKEVEDSYKRYEEGGRIIDQMAYDEYIWIVNMGGTRTVGDGAFEHMSEYFGYVMEMFSTQDLRGLTDYTAASQQERSALWVKDVYGADNAYKSPKEIEPVLDASGNPTGAAVYAQRVTVEWVWQEHKNPVKITSADNASKTGSGGTFQVTAEGYAPFAFSLTGAPAGVVINKGTGLITIPAGLPPNEYTFTIHAEENRPPMSRLDTYIKYEGNDPSPPDEQAFTLKITGPAVTPSLLPSPTPSPTPRMAPVIAEEEHEYAFIKISGISEMNIQLSATGSEPIAWSLVQTGEYPLPEGLTIDPQTGMLTIPRFIAQGRHFFTVRAENDVGFDTQECTLEGKMLSQLYPRGLSSPSGGGEAIAFADTDIFVPASLHPAADATLASRDWRSQYGLFLQEDQPDVDSYLFEMITPPNEVTIRYDDPKDVYTNDRWTVNGAAFVRWQSCPHVYVLWNNNSYGWWWAKNGDMLLDTSPRCDNYHFRVPSDLEMYIARQIEDNYRTEIDLDLIFGRSDNAITIPPRTQNTTYFEYGAVLGKINSKKGGSFLVELNQTTGAMVTGKLFVGLMGNKDASLSFVQDGAAITFAGKDVLAAKEHEFFDFTYYPGSFYESDMLAAVGPDDKNFIFSFRHHGDLPGIAAFAIATGIAEGTNVNVYGFDLETGTFTLIAKDVSVGKEGVVTYKSNAMGQYLVTAKTIEGALISDLTAQQNFDSGDIRLFIGIGLAALLCGGAVLIGVSSRRRRRALNHRR